MHVIRGRGLASMLEILRYILVWNVNAFYGILYFLETNVAALIALASAGYLWSVEWRDRAMVRPPGRRQL